MESKLKVSIKNLVEEAAHIEGIAKIKLAHVFIEKNLMPSVERLRDIAETLKNLDEEAVKRSDYLRVCDQLWKQGFLDCNESDLKGIVDDLLQTLR